MMYRHKNLKQLLCCVLLLCLFCGSSLGFFSVNADTVIKSERNVAAYQNIVGDYVKAYYSVASLAPFIQNVGYDSTASTAAINKSVCQYYVFTISLFNYTSNIYQLDTWYCTILPQTPALNANYKIGYSTEFQSDSISSIEYGTDGKIYIAPHTQYIDSGHIVLAPHSQIMMNFVVCKHIDRFALASDLDISGFDTPVSSVTFTQPNSGVINNSLSITDIYYNSAQEVASLHNIESQLVNIYSQMTNQLQQDNQQLINNQEQTNSNITSQTEQQKEQYDAFSASTDSSDSNNINSAITGGTDAVKEKMGLFSFFDGIVSDLSDTLTSDHERHLVLPALDVPLPEETVHIWDRKEFDFDELENNFGAILTVVRFATVAICYITMINGAYHLFHKFIGVKDSDA